MPNLKQAMDLIMENGLEKILKRMKMKTNLRLIEFGLKMKLKKSSKSAKGKLGSLKKTRNLQNKPLLNSLI